MLFARMGCSAIATVAPTQDIATTSAYVPAFSNASPWYTCTESTKASMCQRGQFLLSPTIRESLLLPPLSTMRLHYEIWKL